MKRLNGMCKAALISAVMFTASASAAPIFSGATGSGGGTVSHMRLDDHAVNFRGGDGSAYVGLFSTGPWKKSEMLRLFQNGNGGGNELPVVPSATGLSEPATGLLLALGLLGVGLVARRQRVR